MACSERPPQQVGHLEAVWEEVALGGADVAAVEPDVAFVEHAVEAPAIGALRAPVGRFERPPVQQRPVGFFEHSVDRQWPGTRMGAHRWVSSRRGVSSQVRRTRSSAIVASPRAAQLDMRQHGRGIGLTGGDVGSLGAGSVVAHRLPAHAGSCATAQAVTWPCSGARTDPAALVPSGEVERIWTGRARRPGARRVLPLAATVKSPARVTEPGPSTCIGSRR